MEPGQPAAAAPATVIRVVEIFKAVADPTRYQLLRELSGDEHSVGELADHLGANVAAVSQHLAKLRTAGLVVSRRDRNRIYYRTAGDQVRRVLDEAVELAEHLGGAEARPDGPHGARLPGRTGERYQTGQSRSH